MLYISPNNEYPRHPGDVQLAEPSWTMGEPLPEGWVEVTPVDPPARQENKIIYEGFPVEVGGSMTQNWQIRDMTAEEIAEFNAPNTAKEKLLALGLTEAEVTALSKGLVR